MICTNRYFIARIFFTCDTCFEDYASRKMFATFYNKSLRMCKARTTL